MTIFVGTLFSLVSKNKRSEINVTKIVKADLDPPCRELYSGGLGIVAAFSFFRQLTVVSACIGRLIQLYSRQTQYSTKSKVRF